MTLIVSHISVAEAATIINALLTFAQFTLPPSLVILLIYFMPKTNSALSWSSISRTVHSSIWPTLLRSDSSSSRSAGATVFTITSLTTLSAILIGVAGVVLPLGLRQGPLVPVDPRVLPARYIPDTSPIGLATTPNRQNFEYGRTCGTSVSMSCPGNPNNPNTTLYSPSTVEIFNSTRHSPFSMQYRRFFTSDIYNRSSGIMGTAQSYVLRDDIFAVEGLIVDMTAGRSGIGFWNMTMPLLPNGGTWSQDILWLEPVTACVDTNLTAEYILFDGPSSVSVIRTFNIIDHGGFYGLTRDYPPSNRDGQHIDLEQHAYKGAILSNRFAMLFLNTTRESSYEGRNYTLESGVGPTLDVIVGLGKSAALPVSYFNDTGNAIAQTVCEGFGPEDPANVTNVQVSCGAFLAPPVRADGGDPHVFDANSRWSQRIHVCASATRASIQTVTFSTLNTSDLADLRITRRPSSEPILWAMEKTDLRIADVNLVWGRVDDRYQGHPSLWTVRSDGLYLPAGSAGMFGPILLAGEPVSAYGVAWAAVYQTTKADSLTDYAGVSDYALKTRLQSLVDKDPVFGHAYIRNTVWTDIMVNIVLGTSTSATILVAPNQPSIEYDFRFAIPGFVLLALWVPAFLAALSLLATRTLTLRYIKQVLNHTSVGRVVVGSSLLRTEERITSDGTHSVSASGELPSNKGHQHPEKSDWADNQTSTHVTLFLDRKDTYESLPHVTSPH